MSKENEDEVSKLKNEVEGILNELTQLELQFTDILKPKLRTSAQGAVDTSYLVAVRRFQNGMRAALLNGADQGNEKTFLEGFKFYEGALTLLKASADSGEIQQCENELIQTLLKIIAKAVPMADENAPYGPFFLYKSCQYLAYIYESRNEFELAMRFHDRAASFSTGIVRDLEYLQKMLNALLDNKKSITQKTLESIKIKHIYTMGTLFLEGFKENNLQKVQNAQRILETLGAQRNISISQILSLIEKLFAVIQPKLKVKGEIKEVGTAIQVPAPDQSFHLSDNIINELRTILKDGIQQLKSSNPESSQNTHLFDTSMIVSEIKDVISKEIKSISSEIVSQILNKMPVGLPSTSRARSGGIISDDTPEIKVVAAAAGERQPRPKLDDMIDSIIVSE
ncbi:MAG: hypothetical protein ACFFD2_01960 [Promethearchaeota archaeon]